MRFKISNLFAVLLAIFTLSAISFGQQATDNTAPTERSAERFDKVGKMRSGRHGGRHEGKLLRAFSELNLTDAQKQQVTTIVETNKSVTSGQREELKQLFAARRSSGGAALTTEQDARARELGSQLREASQKMHNDLLQILTVEQQEQFKQKQTEMRERRRERWQMKQQNKEATTPSVN